MKTIRFVVIMLCALAPALSLADEYSDFVDANYIYVEIAHKASIGCKKSADILLESPVFNRQASDLMDCWVETSNFIVNTVWDFEEVQERFKETPRALNEKEAEFESLVDDIKANEEYVSKALEVIL